MVVAMKVSQKTRDPIDTSAAVETPEHVQFQHQLAGPAKRAVAYLIDLLIRMFVMGVLLLLGALSSLTSDLDRQGHSMGVVLVAYFLLEWGYYVFWETVWSGRSPGKRALGLRVITETGRPLHYLDSILRNLLRAADFLPNAYGLGLIVMGRDPKFRRLGDLVAGTIVVIEDRGNVTEKLHMEVPPTARELSSLPQRIPLSGEEMDALELFLRRAPRLHPARAEELAEIVAPTFAKRVGVRFRGEARRFLEVLYHRARERKAT